MREVLEVDQLVDAPLLRDLAWMLDGPVRRLIGLRLPGLYSIQRSKPTVRVTVNGFDDPRATRAYHGGV